jgi:hypothetical protein
MSPAPQHAIAWTTDYNCNWRGVRSVRKLFRREPHARRAWRASAIEPVLEALENRQLLSLVVDLRLSNGGKSATVSKVGDTVYLDIFATVKGSNSTGADDGLQTVVGSLLSSNVNGGAVNGTLKANLMGQFFGLGSSSGSQKDLDGDGDLDVGSNVVSDASGFFAARAGSVDRSGAVSGNSNAFQIGTATFTVTSLKSSTGQTNLTFRPRNGNGSITGGLWQEDGRLPLIDQSTGSYLAGSPVVIKRSGGGSPPPPPPPPTTLSIGGEVWNDNNSNGALDSGESGKSGVKVYLDLNKNGSLNSGEPSTFTNSSGVYRFDGLNKLPSGQTYRIRIQTPAGYHDTNPSSGYLDTAGGWLNKNFGIKASSTATLSIGGEVYNDANGNGSLNSGESGKGGVKIYLDLNKNGSLDSSEPSTFTNSSGVYRFDGLPKLASGQTYRIRIQTPSGYHNVNPSSGYLDTAGGWLNKNFGIKANSTATLSIGGNVWNDWNGDGRWGAGESGRSGVKIYLDLNKNGRLDSGENSTFTNSSGFYRFDGLPKLPSGQTYRIRIETPFDYRNSNPSSGYLDTAGGWLNKNFGVSPA